MGTNESWIIMIVNHVTLDGNTFRDFQYLVQNLFQIPQKIPQIWIWLFSQNRGTLAQYSDVERDSEEISKNTNRVAIWQHLVNSHYEPR